jgi:fatty acid-binding protein DegV
VPEAAEELARRVREAFHPKELRVREFTQVMGAHTGPGLLGFAFYTEPSEQAPDDPSGAGA